MKEEMIKYLNSRHWASGRDADIIEGFIKEFFSYHPERLSPETLYDEKEESRLEEIHFDML